MGWDEGVGYEEIKKRITEQVNILKDMVTLKANIRLAFLVVYAIQLRNGSRISEAVEAYHKFMEGDYKNEKGSKVTVVRVRKKRKTSEYRKIYFPGFIPFSILKKLKRYNIKVTVAKAKVYARRFLGVNTHTLRYAFITYLALKGVNPVIISKITHHSDLERIYDYTQQVKADNILKELE